MPTFKYSAKNAESKTVAGKIVADDKTAVIEELRKRKLTIIAIKETKETTTEKTRPFQSNKIKPIELVIFSIY